MKTKLDTLRDAAAAGDWRGAIAIAARFPRLGAIKQAVHYAEAAYANPRWLAQLGRDPAECIAAGRVALTAFYGLEVKADKEA